MVESFWHPHPRLGYVFLAEGGQTPPGALGVLDTSPNVSTTFLRRGKIWN